MRGGGNRRRLNDTTAPPPPQISSARNSDASFSSRRPSSSSTGGSRYSSVPISDRSYQLSATRTISAYLSSHSCPISLKPTLPSAREITEILRFLLSRLDFNSTKPEEDLPLLLKHLNCPIKLNKSAMRALNTPHSWPSLLAIIHWFVQICTYNDHLLDSSGNARNSLFQDNSMFLYMLESYLEYIRGNDDEVEALDQEFVRKLGDAREKVDERIKDLEKEKQDLAVKLEGMKSSPSSRELLVNETAVLEADMRKFHTLIEQFVEKVAASEKVLAEKEKLLGTKEGERRKVYDENLEIRKRVEAQGVSCRDAERMKRELQAVERETGDSEAARSSWEEKSWELDATICRRFKEIEELAMECNAVVRRLKVTGDFKYMLNAKGSTAVDVLGLDYKLTLKPAFESIVDKIKISSFDNMQEMIRLRHMSVENNSKIESKRGQIAECQSSISEIETRISGLEMKGRDYVWRNENEGVSLMEGVRDEFNELSIIEEEAEGMLKVSKLKLEEAVLQTEEEIWKCGSELWVLVDMVLKCKESVEANISEMMRDVAGTYEGVKNVYKSSLCHRKEG